jgi:hypothetical protein
MEPSKVLFLTLSFLLTFPYAYAQNKFWVDSSCGKTSVAAINEARYLSGQMADALGQFDIDADLDYAPTMFFNVNFTDKYNLEYFKQTYRNIGNLERVMGRENSRIKIYCSEYMVRAVVTS